jgi:uncharacterized protein (TIGR00369 family)
MNNTKYDLSTPVAQRIAASLSRQGMMNHLDAQLIRAEEGLVEVALPFSEKVTQQQGGFHGGAIGALGDIAGGYAALTVLPEGVEVVTAEYKINFLSGHQEGELQAVGKVVKGGKRIIVTTVEVFHLDPKGKKSLCAVMQQTLVPVPQTY